MDAYVATLFGRGVLRRSSFLGRLNLPDKKLGLQRTPTSLKILLICDKFGNVLQQSSLFNSSFRHCSSTTTEILSVNVNFDLGLFRLGGAQHAELLTENQLIKLISLHWTASLRFTKIHLKLLSLQLSSSSY